MSIPDYRTFFRCCAAFLLAGVLAAAIIALVSVSAVSNAKRKKRMEQALDTIERSPDVRDSFGRRRRNQSAAKKAEKKQDEEPIVPTPELTDEEAFASKEQPESMTPARDAMRRMEREEGRRRRTAEVQVSTDKTLRVAPVDERPEFVAQGKVDDSQTRIFGKVSDKPEKAEEAAPQEAPKQEAEAPAEPQGQETIRLGREEMEELRQSQQAARSKGKTLKDIKPMKKRKKGLFGRKDDDDFVEDYDPQDDDDDLIE